MLSSLCDGIKRPSDINHLHRERLLAATTAIITTTIATMPIHIQGVEVDSEGGLADGLEPARVGCDELNSGEGLGDALSPESPDSPTSGLGPPPPLDTEPALAAVAPFTVPAAGAAVVVTDLKLALVSIPGGRVCDEPSVVPVGPVFGTTTVGGRWIGGGTVVFWPSAIKELRSIINDRTSTGKIATNSRKYFCD